MRLAFVRLAGALCLATLLPEMLAAQAPAAPPAEASLKKAFGLSLVVPGAGHRYVKGDWDGAASLFALADAGLWLGLVGTEWRRGQVVESYETLAASRADAQIEGKDRAFFLNLATYRSSEAYLDTQLRNRNWGAIDYVADPAFQWAWASEDDFRRFQALREDGEALSRRRPFIAAALVGNRLLAALTAVRAARRTTPEAEAGPLSVRFLAPPRSASLPGLRLRWRL